MRLEKAHSFVCKEGSWIGDFLEWFAGGATVCWCCSMLRGVVLGAVTGAVMGLAAGIVL